MCELARAFVRKYPATKDRPFPQTLVVLIVAGDVESLADEELHNCTVIDSGGALTVSVNDHAKQDRLWGWEISDIIESGMSGPLRAAPQGETDG